MTKLYDHVQHSRAQCRGALRFVAMANTVGREVEANEIVRRTFDSLQAAIDELMLEYCPDEMTEEQMRVYEAHQRVVKPAGLA